MVPQKIEEIAHALDQAIARIQRQIEADGASLARTATRPPGSPIMHDGLIRLKALADAADDLRTRLRDSDAHLAADARDADLSTDGANPDE